MNKSSSNFEHLLPKNRHVYEKANI